MNVGRAITEALAAQRNADLRRLGFVRMPLANVWVYVGTIEKWTAV